jgi:DNA-binding winged helix-turn-helix (wHTH) protein/tetratricopeptide (TPR) repeat protein
MENKQQLRARFGEFVIDEAEARLERGADPVELAPRAFQVLCELLRRAGQLVPKDALLDAVWGHRHINEAALKNIVSQLRQALGDDARESVFIQTVSRRGYRFIASVTDIAAERSLPLTPASPLDLRIQSGDAIVGRDAVLGRLQQAIAGARSGQRQIVFLVGEAGIGKSTLVERVVDQADLAVAYGHCIEHYGEAEPYMPVLEALNNLCRADASGATVALLRRAAPTWLLQLPWFVRDEDRTELQREGAGATQDRMLREFGELIDRLSSERPLLMVLEDLHWSDHSTVQLLDYLARRRGSSALMVLVTFRPTELIFKEHPLAALRQELRLRRLCLDIDLEFLSEAELGDYLMARVGHPAPEPFVRLLHAQTSGLPLFVAAIVDELIAAGELRCDESGRWQLPDTDMAVPRSIAAVIETQLNRLSSEQQRALGAASVGGLEFMHLTLAAVLGLGPEPMHAQLEDAAARLPWLDGSGTASFEDGRLAARYRFTHAIYRQVLYERLPALQRLQWHRQWAAVIADAHASSLPEVAAELALHFERGDAPAEAAAQLAIVAARAMVCGAPSDALQAARHALSLARGRMAPTLELELRVAEAVALTRLEVITAPAVVSAFERALALGALDSPAWQRALQGAWWVAYSRAELGRARALGAQMLDLAAQRNDAALRLAGLNASGMVQLLTGEFAASRLSLGEAVDIYATLSGELPPTSFVLDPGVEAAEGLAMVCCIVGEPRRARQLAEQAVVLAAANRNPLSEVTALYSASIMHALVGEFDVVRSLTERIYDLVDDHALPEKRSGFGWLHGQALVAASERADEGLAEMRAAAEAARDLGIRTGLCGFHYHYAVACRLAGREAEAIASIEAGLALMAESGETMLRAPMLLMRAEDEFARGAPEQAEASLRQAIGTAQAQGAALFELQLLAAAQCHGLGLADPHRLGQLLELYRDDPSPLVAGIRTNVAPATR